MFGATGNHVIKVEVNTFEKNLVSKHEKPCLLKLSGAGEGSLTWNRE